MIFVGGRRRRVATISLIASILVNVVIVLALQTETLSRKRLGKSSYIHKQKNLQQQSNNQNIAATTPIASPNEIKLLAQKSLLRRRGSGNYRKAWRHWSTMAIESIRNELSKSLPCPVDQEHFQRLAYRLGVAADHGEMPSFANAGARAGYALDFFCRARLLSDIFVDDSNPSFPSFWTDGVCSEISFLGDNINVETRPSCNITSLGGGPGFDYVGAALASTFRTGGDGGLRIDATVFDYESGWEDLVNSMERATQTVLQQPDYKCRWGGRCDITKSIFDPVNSGCLKEIPHTNIWTCQYCVAENANLLRESDYVFFRELFETAQAGSVFIFTETTPRLWPECHNLVNTNCKYMEVGFVKMKGEQMVLRKSDDAMKGAATAKLSDKDMELLDQFKIYADQQERRIKNGCIRQTAKDRGEQLMNFE